jgi:hypothetical protein
MIFTHEKVDIDAVVSTLVYCITQHIPVTADNITFVPANFKGMKPCDICIDLEKDKHTEPSFLMKFKDHLPAEIINIVNNIDSGYSDSTGLSLMYKSLMTLGYTDLAILQQFEPFVRGWFLLKSELGWAEDNYKFLPVVDIGKYKFIKADHIRWVSAFKAIAIREGITGKVYHEKYNMGITRFTHRGPDLKRLPGINEEGWYVDDRGFLLARGTSKAPSNSHTTKFKNLDDFISWLDSKFFDYKL